MILFYIVLFYGVLLVVLYSMFERSFERSRAPAPISETAKQLQSVTEKPSFSVEDKKLLETIRDAIQSSGEKDAAAVPDLKKKTAPKSKAEYLRDPSNVIESFFDQHM